MVGNEDPALSHLLMDRGDPVGNSPDAFGRRAVHVKVGNTPSEPIPITIGAFSAPADTDTLVASYPDTVTEVYDFKSGGTGGTILMTLTVVYTDSSKTLISTVVRT